MIKNVIFFDVETNGTNPTDAVLSISALKVAYDTEKNTMEKLDIFDRFYFRNEGDQVNIKAIEVNGLTDDEIKKRRKGKKYPRTFKEDINNFYSFCNNVEHYVAHNIRFDRQFIPFILKYQFDTMLENMNILKIPHDIFPDQYKWPKLFEIANFYNVKLDETELHNSMYDVLIMARSMYKMSKTKLYSLRVKEFLIDNISTIF